ncbi:MAG: N-acetylmuramoyl-L-alanine amidase, partial [Actinomycetota bacterium]|nr:N-acetylmuramoyl-L-alanine amidase [Actinomycetota bacterium]
MSLRSRAATLLLTITLSLQAATVVAVGADVVPPAGGVQAAPSIATSSPEGSVAAQPVPGPVPETASATLEGLPAVLGAAAAGATGAAAGVVVTAPVRAPLPFAMLGLELPTGATARVRTSTDGRAWSAWLPTDLLLAGDDGPDAGSVEALAVADLDAERHTEPLWVGASSWLQVELDGAAPADVDATFIDTLGLGGGAPSSGASSDPEPAVEAAAGTSSPLVTSITGTPMPGAITRARWGANESLRNGSPSYAPSVRYAVVHHTAGSNSYTEAQAPAVVRGILHYHTEILGWSDIAYNVLIDRYGNIYEGRAGGMDRAVVGAHAQGF